MIRFLEPAWLAMIVPVLALAGIYVWRTLRRRAFAVRFTNVDLLKKLAPKGIGWRRHIGAVTTRYKGRLLQSGKARESEVLVDDECVVRQARVRTGRRFGPEAGPAVERGEQAALRPAVVVRVLLELSAVIDRRK